MVRFRAENLHLESGVEWEIDVYAKTVNATPANPVLKVKARAALSCLVVRRERMSSNRNFAAVHADADFVADFKLPWGLVGLFRHGRIVRHLDMQELLG